MNKFIIAILAITFFSSVLTAQAGILSDGKIQGYVRPTTENQTQIKPNSKKESIFPGKKIQKSLGTNESDFNYDWKYRKQSYEMHFENSTKLASAIYSLALYSKDITKEIPYEKFVKNVQGFHYSVSQICDWLNHNSGQLSSDECWLIGCLIYDGVVSIKNGVFTPNSKIKHVLGAAPGKKRTFALNLRHERLHVFYDQDKNFKTKYVNKWKSLTEEQKDNEKKKLKNYNSSNEAQLIEEWAIYIAEKNKFSNK